MAVKGIPLWTLFGLAGGKATTRWRGDGAEPGQVDFLGLPRFDPTKCQDGCRACVDVCLPEAIRLVPGDGQARV